MTAEETEPSPRRSSRKRKRAMPPSDSSKTDSARQGTSAVAASYCSSTAGTTSLHVKRTRGAGSTSPPAQVSGGERQGEGEEAEKGKGEAPPPSVEEPEPPKRSQAVRRVEQRVSSMFKELDLLLRAEKINRRVMYRWSGSEKNGVELDENGTSYCTWGRELIKQSVEDAVKEVKEALTMGDWEGALDAARRLTILYLSKATERSMTENERPLHDEVMSSLGNLWFALMPLPQERRQQFRRLVQRVRKASGHHLVVAFRCALDFASIDFSLETLQKAAKEAEGEGDPLAELKGLLRPEVYECDAYVMLWKISEALQAVTGLTALCQEFRLRALDAEMWRAMLCEEQESRQRGGDSDDEEEDDDDTMEEDEDDFNVKDLEALVEAVVRHGTPQEGGGGQGLPAALLAAAGKAGEGKVEPVTWSLRNLAPVSAGGYSSPERRGDTASPLVRTPVASASEYTSERQSWDGRDAADGKGPGDRWNTKAALEEGEREVFTDYLSLHQHQYRRVLTADFRERLWTFLEACEPLGGGAEGQGVKGKAEAQAKAAASKESADAMDVEGEEDPEPSAAEVLFCRARPFLLRVATMLPQSEMGAYLDLLAAKFGFGPTLQLLEPLLVHEPGTYSTARVGSVLDWAVAFEGGKELGAVIRLVLPQLDSRSQLERLARTVVELGPSSFPILDKALARVPKASFEAVAVDLCRRAVRAWGVGVPQGAHLVVLRALKSHPSLGLYLQCRGCFLEPLTNLVRPMVQQLDPCSELSIGVRLVEGMVGSAVGSMVSSLEVGAAEAGGSSSGGAGTGGVGRAERAMRWLDFAFAGVQGGQFPPPLIERLLSNEAFLSAILGPKESSGRRALEALAELLGRLGEIARQHPRAVSESCRSLVGAYREQRPADVCPLREAKVLGVADEILRVVEEVAA